MTLLILTFLIRHMTDEDDTEKDFDTDIGVDVRPVGNSDELWNTVTWILTMMAMLMILMAVIVLILILIIQIKL